MSGSFDTFTDDLSTVFQAVACRLDVNTTLPIGVYCTCCWHLLLGIVEVLRLCVGMYGQSWFLDNVNDICDHYKTFYP